MSQLEAKDYNVSWTYTHSDVNRQKRLGILNLLSDWSLILSDNLIAVFFLLCWEMNYGYKDKDY